MSNVLWWAPTIGRGASLCRSRTSLPVIDPADIAGVAVEALIDERHAGATYLLTGAEAPSPREKIETVSDVLGVRSALTELTEEQLRARSSDTQPDLLDYMVAMMGHPVDEDCAVDDAVRVITGREPGTFRDRVPRHSSALLDGVR